MRYGALGAVLVLSACGRSNDPVGKQPTTPFTAVEDTGWVTDFEACATLREEALFVPVSLFLTVDTSGSMGDGTPVAKWDAAAGAFSSFFTDPEAASVSLALRLWPDATDGCDEIGCDADACAMPQVPLGSLGDPLHQQSLLDALAAVSPDGNTPVSAALDGASIFAQTQLAAVPDGKVAIILVTDGEPNGCDEVIDNIAAIAAGSAAADAPVYVVGIEGSNEAQINQIAAAGGTTAGYFVGSQNAETELLAALDDIRGQIVSCSFAWPTTQTNEPLSPDLVRVEYEVDGQTVSVPRVAGPDNCAAGGWYLNDATDPPLVTLCRSTCTELQDELTLAIEVDVGCECITDDDCPGDNVCTDDGCVPPCEGEDCPPAGNGGTDLLGAASAVQGGAMNCSMAPSGGGGLGVLLLLMAVARRTEDNA